MKVIKLTFLLWFFLFVGNLYSQTVFGKWKTINEKTGKPNSIIEIYKVDDAIHGKVVKIVKEEDRNNRCTSCTGKLKDKPIEGLELLTGLKKDGDEYSGGVITDPQTGKEYKVKIWVDETNPNILNVRGYIAFFYRTEKWERVQ